MMVILFGATGMVGQAVLRECLRDEEVESVLSIGRRPSGVSHPKLQELILDDLFAFDAVKDHVTTLEILRYAQDDGVAPHNITAQDLPVVLRGYDACLFCLGVSSAGMSEAEYTRLTYDLTMGWARKLASVNPKLTFVYVSGAGTGGKAMWAQVKGRTESALLELFPSAYMIRLAMLRPMHRERSQTSWTRISYIIFRPLLPLLHAIAPNAVITTEELGRAMIRAAKGDATKRILESRDLRTLAQLQFIPRA